MIFFILLSIFILLLFAIIPAIIETKYENMEHNKIMKKKKQENTLKSITEVLDMRSFGLCESCDCGIDNCLKAGYAICKHSEGDKK